MQSPLLRSIACDNAWLYTNLVHYLAADEKLRYTYVSLCFTCLKGDKAGQTLIHCHALLTDHHDQTVICFADN